MKWIYAIAAASRVSAIIADTVAKTSSDQERRRKAEKVRDFSRAVADVSSVVMPFASKKPPRP